VFTARLRALLVLAGAVTSLAVAWWWWRPRVPSAPATPGLADPRLAGAAEWPNVHPDVAYAGDEACAGCHATIARSYGAHPMAHSVSPAEAASRIEEFGARARNPFDAGGLRYRVERRGDVFVHHESLLDAQGHTLAEVTAEIRSVVGSGQRGRAYLLDRDGRLFQSPITWYPQKHLWDLSPGYTQKNLHFTRPVIPECLFCHANRVEPVADTTNRYVPPLFRGHAIGCERCHGPGELHVRARQEGTEVEGIDRTIVNPRHLTPALRDAVCQQCHLQGQERVVRRGRGYFDYRPGLPLEEFLVDFVKPPEDNPDPKFVGTVEQMHRSRCYLGTRGEQKLGCISCHDPHARPAPHQQVAHYRDRCLNCHAGRGCSLPLEARRAQNPDDSCIACHMPATGSDVNHTSITDHRIPRRAGGAAPPAPPWPRPGKPPLVPFHPGRKDFEEAQRDLAVALVRLGDRQPDQVNRWMAGEALPLLEAAVTRHPDDLAARDAQGDALWSQGRLEEAMAVYEGTLGQVPRREFTLARASALALRLKRMDLAEHYAREAIDINPWRWEPHLDLATALAERRDWEGVVAAGLKCLELNPFSIRARGLLVNALLRQGQKVRAQAEFEVLLALSPSEKREALRTWFARQLR
jgi:Doubled CXXCH motif (Paired_CXXCH_1)